MARTRREILAIGGTGAALAAAWGLVRPAMAAAERFPVTLTDAQWRKRLGTGDAYAVLRHEATETPGSSKLLKEHRAGIFACAGCAQPLFSSKTKYDSGTGWPSFWAPLANAVGTSTDMAIGLPRTEVHCARCGGHLGHVFDDGPKPTGKRYCMNGVAMRFVPGRA
ncbi:MAG: peptide-methionine (R)-S-oxide reductase MsrB [Sphingomonas sp.]